MNAPPTGRPGFRTVSAALMIAAAVSSAACGSSPSSPAAQSVEPLGEFALISANGSAVPTDVVHDGATMRIVSGSMTFLANRLCVSRMRFIPPGGTEMSTEVSATYTMQGSTLTLQWQGAGLTTGQLQGTTFTMNNEGMILVYRKGG